MLHCDKRNLFKITLIGTHNHLKRIGILHDPAVYLLCILDSMYILFLPYGLLSILLDPGGPFVASVLILICLISFPRVSRFFSLYSFQNKVGTVVGKSCMPSHIICSVFMVWKQGMTQACKYI